MNSDLETLILEKTEEMAVRFGRNKKSKIRVEKNSNKSYWINQGWFSMPTKSTNLDILEKERIFRKGFRSLYDYLKKARLTPVFIFSSSIFCGKSLPFRNGKFVCLNLKEYMNHVKKNMNEDSYIAEVFIQPRDANDDEILERLKTKKLTIASIDRIAALKKTIEEFELKLKNNANEGELRDYLVEHPELLDPGYYNVSREEELDIGRPDATAFKLNKHGLLEDIAVFELKNPDEETETNHRPNIRKPTSTVSGGLAQILAYVEEKSFREKESFVKGYLLIGRTPADEDLKTIKRLNKFLHNIAILTYDEVLERAKQIVGLVEPKDTTKITNNDINKLAVAEIPLKSTLTETQSAEGTKP